MPPQPFYFKITLSEDFISRVFISLPMASSPQFIELLKQLDAQHIHGYPFCLKVVGKHELEVPTIQARLPELMPHAHAAGLVSVEAAGERKEETKAEQKQKQPEASEG